MQPIINRHFSLAFLKIKITIPALFSVLFLMLTVNLHAEENRNLDSLLFDIPDKGYHMIKLGYFNDAAIAWISDARTFLVSGDVRDKQRAGILHVMATIAFEKAGNIEAYATWSDAIRYFLEGSTTWDAVQKELRRSFNSLDHDLQTAAINAPTLITPNESETIWIEIQEQLDITGYTGPSPGLQSRQITRKPKQKAAGARYVPRPFAETQGAPQATPEASQTHIRRGIPVEEHDDEQIEDDTE